MKQLFEHHALGWFGAFLVLLSAEKNIFFFTAVMGNGLTFWIEAFTFEI